MPALSDSEDAPPHYRSKMSDNETTETLAPPTDREAPTNPENAPPARNAINPAPLASASQGDSYMAAAARDFAAALVEMRLTRTDIANGFAGQSSKLDEMAREFAANYHLLSGEFKSFRAVVEARLDDGERRFDAIERSLEELKREQLTAAGRALEAAQKISNLESELVELRKHVPARTAPTPPAEPA